MDRVVDNIVVLNVTMAERCRWRFGKETSMKATCGGRLVLIKNCIVDFFNNSENRQRRWIYVLYSNMVGFTYQIIS